jgi:Aspartyl/Asparaginyl beta-hydroxylase
LNNFVFLQVIEAYDLVCSLRQRAGLFTGGPIRTLMLRGPKKGAEDHDDAAAYLRSREAARWPELTVVLKQIERVGERVAGGPVDVGRVSLQWLDAGAVVPWRRESGDYYARFWRLHLPLRTNPGAMVYSGIESIQVLPGQLTQVNVLAYHSAVNLGETPRVHLVVDLAKRAVTEREEVP